MNKSAWKIIILALLISCDAPVMNKNSETDTTKLSVNNKIQSPKKKFESINPIHPNGTDSIDQFYDTIVNGIIIGDTISVQNKLGKNIPKINDVEKSNFGILKRCCVYNKSHTQFLTLYFLSDGATMLSEIQVESCNAGQSGTNSLTVSDNEFVTGQGIKLGMSEKEFLKMFGKPSETERSAYGVTKYSYQQYEGSYYGDYYFSNGVLLKFKFGRELILCT